MAWYHEIVSSLGALFGRRRQEREMDEEIAFHIEMETRRLVESGLDAHEARRRAVRAFGGVERHKDDVRDERGETVLLSSNRLETGSGTVRLSFRLGTVTPATVN